MNCFFKRRSLFSLAVILALSVTLMSFVSRKMGEDFLKQLGLTEADADNKISQGIFTGYVNTYALVQAKKVPTGTHSAIVASAIGYAKRYTASDAFREAYAKVKAEAKPVLPPIPLTPDSLKKDLEEKANQALQSAQTALKTASAELKPVMEELVQVAKNNLEEARKPDNPYIEAYSSNYNFLLEQTQHSRKQMLSDWEKEYPASVQLFLKNRLQQFMKETSDIDFAAQTILSNGKLRFANPAYEGKSKNWKLAYRSGEVAINAARKAIGEWLKEIGNP